MWQCEPEPEARRVYESGRDRLALQTPGLYLPVERDLRRHRLVLGLRLARRGAKEKRQTRVGARQRLPPGRRGRARRGEPGGPQTLEGGPAPPPPPGTPGPRPGAA